MFAIGDFVSYSSRGICKIISAELIDGEEYFILEAAGNAGCKIFVPKSSAEEKLHPIISKDEIYKILSEISSDELEWIEDDRQRQTSFKEIISLGNKKDIMRLARLLFKRKEQLKKLKKNLHLADGRIFSEAEALLFEEFSFVLNKNKSEIIEFIATECDNTH